MAYVSVHRAFYFFNGERGEFSFVTVYEVDKFYSIVDFSFSSCFFFHLLFTVCSKALVAIFMAVINALKRGVPKPAMLGSSC